MLPLAILALGFLIIVHEAGHFFVARWCGMRVERFSIGFGPGLLKKRSKGGTVFQLAPIPFGGFVEIRGMNLAEEVDPADTQAYPNRPAWQRFLAILAGPATNYVSAIFLAFGLYTCHGQPTHSFHIDKLTPGYHAETQLRPEDRILAIDGVAIYGPSPSALSWRVNDKNGAPITLTIRRGDRTLDVTVQPKAMKMWDIPGLPEGLFPIVEKVQDWRPSQRFPYVEWAYRTESGSTFPFVEQVPLGHYERRYRIGVQLEQDVVRVGLGEAVADSLRYPIDQTKMIMGALRDIMTGDEDADPGGPIRIVGEFKTAFDRGLAEGIRLLMVLSVYLGLFNLFPLPALDGGRLVFLAYEMITRRRANPKIETMVHMVGIMLLMVVMVAVTLRDVGAL